MIQKSQQVRQALSKIKDNASLVSLEEKMMRLHNPWRLAKQTAPNADKLIDGAIQRVSVLPRHTELHPLLNQEKVGFYKSDDLTERASRLSYMRQSCFHDDESYKRRIARITQLQIPHTQCHPWEKTIQQGWQLSFESWGQYNSPLMFWSTGSQDMLSRHTFKFPTLSATVKWCEAMGWGYDIQYSHAKRWHTKKSYADNFMWKGHPQEGEGELEEYD
ncbi:hypothetical protein FGO68_gene6435 [Halteria grandinella]|uniref:NADH dehydrogenase [ubiquinone] iron-sulfur protein 4, mitochondrial n=1 Tax=Halteria grandinella TaxID=5974 RepID=A0A8J8SYI9_HALGN|nr:hypothetical protein FGO68_gene6435 [Halteria grandinella]